MTTAKYKQKMHDEFQISTSLTKENINYFSSTTEDNNCIDIIYVTITGNGKLTSAIN